MSMSLRPPLAVLVLFALGQPVVAQAVMAPAHPVSVATSREPTSRDPVARRVVSGPIPVKLTRMASLLAKTGEIRIVAFGSSSTQGAGASSPAAAYPALLETDLEERLLNLAGRARAITVINRGKGGDDSEAMALRLERDVLAERPDLVVWQTGSNDPIKGVPVERFVALTRAGITAIRATGADVVLMDQQWCRRLSGIEDAERYGEALQGLAAEMGVPVIRRHALMESWVARGLLTTAQMIGPDGLHMTDAGYRQLAKAAATQILSGAGLILPPPVRIDQTDAR